MVPVNFRQVQFADFQDLARYVEDEITRAMPEGWKFEREMPQPIPGEDAAAASAASWLIFPDERHRNCAYILTVSADHSLFIIYHGNSDAGPFDLHHALRDAKVMDRVGLRFVPLSDALLHVFDQCKPNEWGLT